MTNLSFNLEKINALSFAKWNKKVYGGNSIYLNNEKVELSKQEIAITQLLYGYSDEKPSIQIEGLEKEISLNYLIMWWQYAKEKQTNSDASIQDVQWNNITLEEKKEFVSGYSESHSENEIIISVNGLKVKKYEKQ